jgi:hypothetical protein
MWLIAAISLSACASQGVRPLRPEDLATAPYQSLVTDAYTGSLLYEGGCLLFRDDENRIQVMPVWPSGSIFNGTSVIFHQPGKSEQRVVVEEEFQIEGQPIAWNALAGPVYAQFQRQCGASPPFFVSRVHPAN